MAAATKGPKRPFPLTDAFFLFRFIKIPCFTYTSARCVILCSIKSHSNKHFNTIFVITKRAEHDLVESHFRVSVHFFYFHTTTVVPDIMQCSTY